MLVVPSGGIIIELGNLCMQLHFRENNALSKYAAPGNAYYDFIPTVLKYYKNEGIEVEDVSVIFEKDMFKCLGYQLEEYEIENYVKKLEELRKYCSENNIRFISMDSDDSAYIEYINKNNNPFFCNNKKFSVDLDAI